MKTLRLPLTFAALLTGATLSAPAATLFVTTLADNGPGSLRRAIVSAADGDTINFKVTGTITLTSGQLVVDKKLNIVGPTPSVFGFNWITVSGNDQSRVFDITTTGDVEISKLNVVHGFSFKGYKEFDPLKNGGGIRNLGKLHLIACAVRDNLSSTDSSADHESQGGGGIFNLGTLLVENCGILHNSADYYQAGGGILNVSKLKLVGSTIAHNKATFGPGLAHNSNSDALIPIILPSPHAQLEIVNCTFNDNAVSRHGGGLYIIGAGDLQTALIDRTTFVANQVSDAGGGIYAQSSVSIKDSTISGNTARYRGGGLAVDPFSHATYSLTVALNNVTITDNTVQEIDHYGIDGNGAGVLIGNLPQGRRIVTRLVAANTIIADNHNVNNLTGANDVWGRLISLGHNLIQDTTGTIISGDQTGNIYGLDPKLDSLSDNGGPTLTHALIGGSPAIDAGDDTTAEPTDQRGVARPVGANSDIGAYEGSIPGRIDINLLYRPVPYIIVCDPAGPYPPFIVTIVGDRSFSVRTIDTTSLRLQTRTAAPVAFRYGDVNGDGSVDLVLKFDLNQALQGQACEAVTQLDLVGTTLTGQDLIGHVQIDAGAR